MSQIDPRDGRERRCDHVAETMIRLTIHDESQGDIDVLIWVDRTTPVAVPRFSGFWKFVA
jgi:hypothetical protein